MPGHVEGGGQPQPVLSCEQCVSYRFCFPFLSLLLGVTDLSFVCSLLVGGMIFGVHGLFFLLNDNISHQGTWPGSQASESRDPGQAASCHYYYYRIIAYCFICYTLIIITH